MASEEPKTLDSPLFAAMDRLAPRPEMRAPVEAALKRILALGGLPKKKDEMFTFANIRPHIDAEFIPRYGAPSADAGAARKHVYPDYEKSALVFVDAEWRPDLSDVSAVKDDVTVRPFSAWAATPSGRDRLTSAAEGENDFLACVNNAFAGGGAAISVRPGARPAQPLMLLFFSTGGDEGRRLASFPRVVVDIGKGAQAALVVKYAGGAGNYMVNGLTDVAMADGAALDWSQIQADPQDAVHFSKVRLVAGTGARFNGVNASTGSAMTRHHYDFHLDGEGAELSFAAVSVLDGKNEAHNYVRARHAAPRCVSRQLFRNIVGGSARSSVDTSVIVLPGAQLTDSNQLVNNLMLSPSARADNKPNLNIHANDVKCTHGATAGRLDEDQIFYLNSRGIAADRARALLTTSFAEAVIGRMPFPAAARDARELLMKKLEATDFGKR